MILLLHTECEDYVGPGNLATCEGAPIQTHGYAYALTKALKTNDKGRA